MSVCVCVCVCVQDTWINTYCFTVAWIVRLEKVTKAIDVTVKSICDVFRKETFTNYYECPKYKVKN